MGYHNTKRNEADTWRKRWLYRWWQKNSWGLCMLKDDIKKQLLNFNDPTSQKELVTTIKKIAHFGKLHKLNFIAFILFQLGILVIGVAGYTDLLTHVSIVVFGFILYMLISRYLKKGVELHLLHLRNYVTEHNLLQQNQKGSRWVGELLLQATTVLS